MKFTEKFLPLFSFIEDWICEDKQTPTTAINDSNISIDINDSIENIDNDSNSISNVNNNNNSNSNNVNNNSNVNNSNVNSSSTLEMDIKWLYDYSFCLAVDCEKVAALKSLLEMADNATLLAKPPQDNNEALIRVNKYSKIVVLKSVSQPKLLSDPNLNTLRPTIEELPKRRIIYRLVLSHLQQKGTNIFFY